MSDPERLPDRQFDREVYFYFPEREALDGLDPLMLDADRDWFVFGTGVYVWILQTFVRLRDAGAPVRLAETPPARGLVVVHADHLERLLVEALSPDDLTIVVAQADRAPSSLAEFTIVQNAARANRTHVFVPHWCQPGLMARDLDRATRVENVGYFGNIRELHPSLADPAWPAILEARGLSWDPRTITFSGNDCVYPAARWNDYSAVDAIIAVRARESWGVRPKPATKLQNAWAAGIPAIVSPEEQYQEVYRSPLDYLAAENRDDVLAALDTLRANPGLYQDMVENGLVRVREFAAGPLVTRWVDVLWREIPRRASTRTYRLLAKTRRCRALARRLGVPA